MTDIKIPSSTLAELRGVLVRALSRENLSLSDKLAIRKSQSASSLKNHYAWKSSSGGKQSIVGKRQRKTIVCSVVLLNVQWKVLIFFLVNFVFF